MLSAASPKFEGAVTPRSGAENAAPAESSFVHARLPAPEITVPANTIIRLPEYNVRERKPRPVPKCEEVLADAGGEISSRGANGIPAAEKVSVCVR